MDRLDMMKGFVEVARHGGFAPAARQLDMSTSALSRHIAALEEWLGVQLFHRTSRHVGLTDAGQGYLVRCRKILDEVRDIEQVGEESQTEMTGTIRISAPVFLGRKCIAPILAAFLKQHPYMKIDLFLSDRLVDLVAEGFDLAIRVTKPEDSSLIARRLGAVRLCLVAAPDYLARHGTPISIGDLKYHACIIDRVPESGDRWVFSNGTEKQAQRVGGHVRVNDGETTKDFAVAGLGLARLPGFFVEDELRSGQLVEVELEREQDEVGFYALYPPSRFLSRSLRALIDLLVVEVGKPEPAQ